MNYKKILFHTDRAGFVLGAVLLATLTGCVGYVDGPHAAVYAESPVFVAQDDYIYYPGYNVYYSSSRHQYAYQDHGAWVSRPAPRGVSVNVLVASPSVKMDFHDSPANHHTEIAQRYPKNWTPPASNHGQQEKGKDERHDEHGENNGR